MWKAACILHRRDAHVSFISFIASRKGEAMTSKTIQGRMWDALFEEHHSELLEVAEMLLYRHGSPEAMLLSALAELDGRPIDKAFGKVAATRAVVKAAIAHNYSGIDSWILIAPSGSFDEEPLGPLPLEALPWAERATYFLRDVLHYSRRDCALLLGISDTNVDELNRFARKRMGIPFEAPHQLRKSLARTNQAACPAHSMAYAASE